jgi:hypothetical protein
MVEILIVLMEVGVPSTISVCRLFGPTVPSIR